MKSSLSVAVAVLAALAASPAPAEPQEGAAEPAPRATCAPGHSLESIVVRFERDGSRHQRVYAFCRDPSLLLADWIVNVESVRDLALIADVAADEKAATARAFEAHIAKLRAS